MGLDIYLYKYDDHDLTTRLEKEYEDRCEAAWKSVGGYSAASEEDKSRISAENDALAEKLGLGEYGSDDARKHRIRIDSPKYPEHYFKIGYLRSSYNDSGINNILRNMGLPDLYAIFEPNDRYEFQPDWSACLERALQVLREYDRYAAQHGGLWYCDDVAHNIINPNEAAPHTEKDALTLFQSERDRHFREYKGDDDTDDTSGYSNINGYFYLRKPLTVYGMIPGYSGILGREQPCTYIITKREEEGSDFYRQALEITAEMCAWVLEQPEIDKYWLHWSG